MQNLKVTLHEGAAPDIITGDELKPGELAVIVDESPLFNRRRGEVVLGFLGGMIQLSRPDDYWPNDNSVQVRRLPKGTKVTLEAV